MDSPFDSDIVIDVAADGDDVVTVLPRGFNVSRAVVLVFLSCWLIAWMMLTLSPAAAGWGPRLHAAGLGARVIGVLQLLVMVLVWAATLWFWASALVTIFGEEEITIGADVAYTRGAFGVTRTRRWPIVRVSGFRYHPFPPYISRLARGLRPEISLQTSTGGIDLAPGVIGDEAEWLVIQLNELLAQRRPPLAPRE